MGVGKCVGMWGEEEEMWEEHRWAVRGTLVPRNCTAVLF